MKKTTIYICIFLLFPLIVNFSHAAELAGAVCTHCNKQLYVEADCCAMEEVIQVVKECHPVQDPLPNCPHGGMCQGGEFIPNVVNNVVNTEVSVTAFAKERLVYSLPAYTKSVRSREPPPQDQISSLFLFNCIFSYLIPLDRVFLKHGFIVVHFTFCQS